MHPTTPGSTSGSLHPTPGARTERGASALEYALLIAAVAAVVIAVIVGIGSIVKDAIDHTNDCITTGGTSTSCPAP